MTKNNISKLFDNYYFTLTATVVLGFVASYVMLPKSGIFSTFPVCLICGIAAGFLKQKWLLSAGVFAITAYLMVSFSVAEFDYALIASVLAALTALAGCLCVWLFKKKSVAKTILSAFILLIACTLHFSVFGNPISAINSSNMIDSYYENTYTDSAVKEGIRFDRKKRQFFVQIYGKNDVTNVKTVYCDGEKIYDNYKGHAIISVMSNARLTLQSKLRQAFPNGNFLVVSKGSSAFLGEKIDVSEQLDDSLIPTMCFDIQINSALDINTLSSLARDYFEALKKAGLNPDILRIRSGNAGKFYYSITPIASTGIIPVKFQFEPDDPFAVYTTKKIGNVLIKG